jgi:hypothetical protein
MNAIYRIYKGDKKRIDDFCNIVDQNMRYDFYTSDDCLNLISLDQTLPETIVLKFQEHNKTKCMIFKEDKNKCIRKIPETITTTLFTRYFNDIYFILSPNYFGSYSKEVNIFTISINYVGPLKIENIYEKL